MKSKLLMMVAALAMVGSLSVAPSAQAYYHGGGGHYYGHGGYWHGGGRGFYGLGLGLAAGALLTYPYYSGYYSGYYAPTYLDSGSVTVYDDSSPSQVVQATPNSPTTPVWYYCQSPKGYYPYVQECPSGWQKVAATPPH